MVQVAKNLTFTTKYVTLHNQIIDFINEKITFIYELTTYTVLKVILDKSKTP